MRGNFVPIPDIWIPFGISIALVFNVFVRCLHSHFKASGSLQQFSPIVQTVELCPFG